jgi:hypothetical protein
VCIFVVMCIVVILCVFVALCVCFVGFYFFYLVFGLLARSQYSEGLRPTNSTQDFLGFTVSISEC